MHHPARSYLASLFVSLVLVFATSAWAEVDYAAVSDDKQGAVATVHPVATQAGINALEQGGNAIDAAIAAALTLGVVDGHNSGIGGGLFALVYWADGRVEAIDAREMAPAKAHRDMYVRDGKVDKSLSKTGALAMGIPGSVAAFEYLSKKGGKLEFSQLLLPAADVAEQGFAIDKIYAKRIARHVKTLQQYPGSAEVLLNGEGQAWPAGHKLVQKDLAETYRGIARDGAAYFYRGEFAKTTAEWMQANQGLISREDFANYHLAIREPVRSQYGDYTLYGFPPPSSGGVHVAQILQMLSHFDLNKADEAKRYHLLGEAMKLAFADRAHWLGDPDFAKVPRGLTDAGYTKELAGMINTESATAVASHHQPPNADVDLFGKHTTHISAADKAGNWVAITTTVNTNFGSKVIIPGTGVIMNNQMDDFSAQPGVPNAYGLVGTEANSIQPGKRPLSSMSPTIIVKDKRPVMTVGAAGGPTIITQVVQAIVNHLTLGKPLYDAIDTPRVHQQWKPDRLFVEGKMPAQTKQALASKGHQLKTMGPYGSTTAIAVDNNGEFVAVSEPRLRVRNR
ncbi:gamma-glutamyltransferase [Maricurvus nonylphenolicus]|uniref:gamma-glutamyltransferase n=1 Tax=Maricurvus nonylphenolicus TaxID=1008307 RepID=UPI0036F1D0CF